MSLEENLSLTRFSVDKNAHIRIDKDRCKLCQDKPCIYVCPAKNYKWEDNDMSFSWVGCLECGSCRMVCEHFGNRGIVQWNYPRGGFGASFRLG